MRTTALPSTACKRPDENFPEITPRFATIALRSHLPGRAAGFTRRGAGLSPCPSGCRRRFGGAAPPPRLVAPPPPGLPLPEVAPDRVVPVPPALPQERKEQPVVLRVRLPRPLGQPRDPRPAQEPGQHRGKLVLRVNEDRMARPDVRSVLPLVQISPPASTGARRAGTGRPRDCQYNDHSAAAPASEIPTPN